VIHLSVAYWQVVFEKLVVVMVMQIFLLLWMDYF